MVGEQNNTCAPAWRARESTERRSYTTSRAVLGGDDSKMLSGLPRDRLTSNGPNCPRASAQLTSQCDDLNGVTDTFLGRPIVGRSYVIAIAAKRGTCCSSQLQDVYGMATVALVLVTNASSPDGQALFYIQCPSVEAYIVAALATKPHKPMMAISANTVGTSSPASQMSCLFLSIRHPSRQREQVNAVIEWCCMQVERPHWPEIKV